MIAAGRFKPSRELVFPPAGGVKGVKAVASILGGRTEMLPVALFDSDSAGRETTKSLRSGLYAGEPDLVLEIGSFVGGMADAETEEIIINQFDRWQRASAVPFADEYKPGTAIVPQIEAWAVRQGVTLAKPGWKVELAKRVKQQLLADGHQKIPGPSSISGRSCSKRYKRRGRRLTRLYQYKNRAFDQEDHDAHTSDLKKHKAIWRSTEATGGLGSTPQPARP